MSGFKKIKQADKLVLRQRGGRVVFLESDADLQIIAERWFFDQGEDIDFRAADAEETAQGGGGCKAVIDLVADTRKDGIKAFGLIDRDVLLTDKNWPLWTEIQDAKFVAARPYGKHIRVLLRWELENYLLDPNAMADVINDATMSSTHGAESVAMACLGCADELKDKSAAVVVAVAAGKRPPAPGFGCNPAQTGAALNAALQEHLAKQTIPNAPADLARTRQAIDAFDSPASPALERWRRLIRMLDGKATLKYLGCRTRDWFGQSIGFDARRAELSRRMRERGKIPTEIRDYIEEFRNAA